MPALLWQRDLGSKADGVRNTFSSWDSCMSEAYCKWPAIIGIIIGSLIVISIIWCCARCLCCGAECCCGCLSCFNACCPSPRRRNQGYEQAPPQSYPPYSQYQSAQQPMYGAGGYGYRGAQTATFDAPSKNGKYNEDALPAMPSWEHAQSKHVEEEDVEMEKLDHSSAQQESLLPRNDAVGAAAGGRYYNTPVPDAGADLGTMHTGPYHDYDQHQQFVGSPVSTAPPSIYPPTYRTQPQPSVYNQQNAAPYAASVAPSYHTSAPNVVSPVQQQQMPMGGMGRKPVQGSWRDV